MSNIILKCAPWRDNQMVLCHSDGTISINSTFLKKYEQLSCVATDPEKDLIAVTFYGGVSILHHGNEVSKYSYKNLENVPQDVKTLLHHYFPVTKCCVIFSDNLFVGSDQGLIRHRLDKMLIGPPEIINREYSVRCCAVSFNVIAWAERSTAYAGAVELKGHKGTIYSCAIDPKDNNIVVTTASDGTIRVWNIREARLERIIGIQEPRIISSGVFSSDGSFFVACLSNPNHVGRWDINWKQLKSYRNYIIPIIGCSITSDNRVLTALVDGTVVEENEN